MPIVTFDYDKTLSRKEVQTYAIELMAKGVDVWVVTARFDDLHAHRYPSKPSNKDLWATIDAIGLPRYKVRFTYGGFKVEYLMHTFAIWHLDDDLIELEEMEAEPDCKVEGIHSLSENWKQNCEDLLKDIF